MVRDVFSSSHIAALTGWMGVAHVRYPTAGSSSNSEGISRVSDYSPTFLCKFPIRNLACSRIIFTHNIYRMET
jgi:hypothetical protein